MRKKKLKKWLDLLEKFHSTISRIKKNSKKVKLLLLPSAFSWNKKMLITYV